MADISVIVKGTTSDNKTSTTSITYVNPQATDIELYNLGVAMGALTTLTDQIIIKQTQEILTSGGE